jgi:hypothetical protein
VSAPRTAITVPERTSGLDPKLLANQLGVQVRTPEEIPSLAPEDLEELLGGHPQAWSAISVQAAAGMIVIYNPTHDPGRINNSLAHELSHLLLEHQRGSLHLVGDQRASCENRDACR